MRTQKTTQPDRTTHFHQFNRNNFLAQNIKNIRAKQQHRCSANRKPHLTTDPNSGRKLKQTLQNTNASRISEHSTEPPQNSTQTSGIFFFLTGTHLRMSTKHSGLPLRPLFFRCFFSWFFDWPLGASDNPPIKAALSCIF